MGRPLNKKYFGNRNTGSPTATNDSGIGGEGVASITVSSQGNNYSQGATISIAASPIGGDTATGTITMAVNTGVTSVGTLTVATGVSAQFRIRRTATNTFVLYRLG